MWLEIKRMPVGDVVRDQKYARGGWS